MDAMDLVDYDVDVDGIDYNVEEWDGTRYRARPSERALLRKAYRAVRLHDPIAVIDMPCAWLPMWTGLYLSGPAQ